MRRVLHCLLVGFLTFSMSVDTARACWHRRAVRACRPVTCVVPAHAVSPWSMRPPIQGVPCSDGAVNCHGWRIAEGCCEGAEVVPLVIEEAGCGRPLACCSGADVTPVVEAAVAAPVESAPASVIAPVVPTPAEVPAEKPAAVVDFAPNTVPPQTLADKVVPDKPVSDKPDSDKPGKSEVEKTVAATPVPELKSVEPVTAIEPAATPVPKPATEPTTEPNAPIEPPAPKTDAEPAPPAPVPVPASEPAPAKPKEENIFEEVEKAAGDPAEKPAEKPGQPEASSPAAPTAPAAPTDAAAPVVPATPTIEPPAVPLPTPGVGDVPAQPAATAPAPAAATATENGPAPSPSTEEKPAAEEKPAEPAGEAKPVDEAKPSEDAKPAEEAKPALDLDNASREPLRRWIDDTGTFATVGSFVELRGDGVEIRKANGRLILVPVERLSDHDRTYAAEAAERLAARKASGPNASETAGL